MDTEFDSRGTPTSVRTEVRRLEVELDGSTCVMFEFSSGIEVDRLE